MSPITRRSFLKRCRYFWAPLLLGSGGAYAYGSQLERHRITVEHHKVPLALGDAAPGALRVVSLTDFHFDPLHEIEFFAECVRRVNELKPDVVMLTGDFVTQSHARIGELTQELGKLKPKHGIYACMGNHDQWNNRKAHISQAIRQAGIELLINQHTRVSVSGASVLIAGLDSVWSGYPHLGAAISGLKSDERVIALMHEPDFADTICRDKRVALQLSGHTHGGQVRVPGMRPLRLPTWGLLYHEGFYDVNGMKLYVNRGLGTIAIHIRFMCPPEIACLDVINTGTVISRR
jgi:predicted MPP superfamily phosphohydrolase